MVHPDEGSAAAPQSLRSSAGLLASPGRMELRELTAHIFTNREEELAQSLLVLLKVARVNRHPILDHSATGGVSDATNENGAARLSAGLTVGVAHDPIRQVQQHPARDVGKFAFFDHRGIIRPRWRSVWLVAQPKFNRDQGCLTHRPQDSIGFRRKQRRKWESKV